MSDKVYILEAFCNELNSKKVQNASEGILYGFNDKNMIVLMGACYDVESLSATQAINMLPYPIQKLGLILHQEKSENTQFQGSGFLLLRTDVIRVYDLSKSNKAEVSFNVLNDVKFKETFLTLRVIASLDVFSSDAESLVDQIEQLKENVMLEAVKINDKILTHATLNEKKKIQDLCPESKDNELKVVFLQLKSCKENDVRTSVIVKTNYSKCKLSKTYANIKVDSLCLCLRKTPQSMLIQLARQSVDRFLCSFVDKLGEKSKSENVLKPHHFFVKSLGHPVTVLYNEKYKPDEHAKERERMHLVFDLPLNRPCFRKGSTMSVNVSNVGFNNPTYSVVNVHVGLNSGVNGGKCVTVCGKYTYFHYMQDNFNDSGWGCAYRSLQTIFSWYLWQGYTHLDVPDHKSIQECLVKLKDKPKSFIGSRQWIGSSEIAFCLDEMLGVECEILHVTSREDLVSYGSKLEAHFLFNDTPVMIGGGQLAHTIIGTHFNKEDGEIKFLVLDPHYIGKDDIKSIQSKGGVAWRPITFWEKNSFFNLCLPKKPKVAY